MHVVAVALYEREGHSAIPTILVGKSVTDAVRRIRQFFREEHDAENELPAAAIVALDNCRTLRDIKVWLEQNFWFYDITFTETEL